MDQQTLSEKNRQIFNEQAHSHNTNDSNFGTLIQAVIHEFQTRRDWISPKLSDKEPGSKGDNGESKIRLLDYACGTGTASKALVQYVDQVVGLDVAENMVAEYNKATSELGFQPDRMHAYTYDLLGENSSSKVPEHNLYGFDIAIVSMALHHVADPELLLSRLAQSLKPGGVCIILDMLPETLDHLDNHSHGDHGHHDHVSKDENDIRQTINKRGFSEEDMVNLFSAAGLGQNMDYVTIEKPFEMTMKGKEFKVAAFIARGGLKGPTGVDGV